MHRIRTLTLMAASIAAAYTLLPTQTAEAKRKSPLEGKPVVVDKLELRKLRFAVTPVAAMSLSQPYNHAGYAGGRLTFYITDWIGVRGSFMFAFLHLDAKLLRAVDENPDPGSQPFVGGEGREGAGGLPLGEINPETGRPERPINQKDNPAPLLHDFRAGLTKNQFLASADIVFVPFNGKLGLFSGIFTEYDIYLFGGLGISNWVRHYPNQESTAAFYELDSNPDSMTYCQGAMPTVGDEECLLHPVLADTGVKLGPSFGAGLHLFLGVDWASVNLEIQDIMSYNNIVGLNATTDDVPPKVTGDDANWNHNVTFQLGFKFYFPPRAKRSKYPPESAKGKGKGKASASVGKKK